MVMIGPSLQRRLLRYASRSMEDAPSHLIVLIMGNPPGPGGSLGLGFRENKALIRAVRQAVTMIRNQVSIVF